MVSCTISGPFFCTWPIWKNSGSGAAPDFPKLTWSLSFKAAEPFLTDIPQKRDLFTKALKSEPSFWPVKTTLVKPQRVGCRCLSELASGLQGPSLVWSFRTGSSESDESVILLWDRDQDDHCGDDVDYYYYHYKIFFSNIPRRCLSSLSSGWCWCFSPKACRFFCMASSLNTSTARTGVLCRLDWDYFTILQRSALNTCIAHRITVFKPRICCI